MGLRLYTELPLPPISRSIGWRRPHSFCVRRRSQFLKLQGRWATPAKVSFPLCLPSSMGSLRWSTAGKTVENKKGGAASVAAPPIFAIVRDYNPPVKNQRFLPAPFTQGGLFARYSVRRATTGSFLAALRAGIIPEISVSIILIPMRIKATGMGRMVRRLGISVRYWTMASMGMHRR